MDNLNIPNVNLLNHFKLTILKYLILIVCIFLFLVSKDSKASKRLRKSVQNTEMETEVEMMQTNRLTRYEKQK